MRSLNSADLRGAELYWAILFHVAEADQAERPPDETEHRLARRDLPAPGAHEPIVERHLARAGEEEGHRVLGDVLDAVGGVVGDDDAGRGRGVEVDGVDADAVTGD